MFLTGEFSRIARISKRMLQHYDRIGLFSPEYTDNQTGYRYYSARQLPRLNRILALKDLGLTLDQVRRMIDEDISLDEIKGMLLLQKAELEQQLRESLDRIQRVESRLDRLSDNRTSTHPEVVLKSVPTIPYLATRRIFENVEAGQALMFELMTQLPARVGKSSLGHLMSVMYSPVFEMENSDSEIGFILEKPTDTTITLSDTTTLSVSELPAIETMATVVQVGQMDMLPLGYATLAEWIEAHHYRIAGPQREIYLEISTDGNPDDLVVEIQFPVEKLPTDFNLLTS